MENEHLRWRSSLPFPDVVAGFLEVVFEGGEPDDSAVSFEPGELLFGELADGDSQFGAQLVEGASPAPQMPRYVAVFQAEFVEPEVGDAAGAERGDFIDHPAGQALPEAL